MYVSFAFSTVCFFYFFQAAKVISLPRWFVCLQKSLVKKLWMNFHENRY